MSKARHQGQVVALAAALGAALLSVALAVSDDPSIRREACEAAAAYLKLRRQKVAMPLVVEWRKLQEPLAALDDRVRQYPELRHDPGLPLARAQAAVSNINPFETCDAVRAVIRQPGIIYLNALSERAQEPWRVSGRRVEGMSAPGIAADGRVGFEFRDWLSTWGGLGSVRMKQDAQGRWQIESRQVEVIGG